MFCVRTEARQTYPGTKRFILLYAAHLLEAFRYGDWVLPAATEYESTKSAIGFTLNEDKSCLLFRDNTLLWAVGRRRLRPTKVPNWKPSGYDVRAVKLKKGTDGLEKHK